MRFISVATCRIPVAPKDPGRPVKKLTAPLRDRVRTDIELLRPFGQRLLPLDRGQGYFALSPGVWFRRLRFVKFAPELRQIMPLSGRKST